MINTDTINHGDKVTVTANPETGDIEALAVFDASLERLFRALATQEVCNW